MASDMSMEAPMDVSTSEQLSSGGMEEVSPTQPENPASNVVGSVTTSITHGQMKLENVNELGQTQVGQSAHAPSQMAQGSISQSQVGQPTQLTHTQIEHLTVNHAVVDHQTQMQRQHGEIEATQMEHPAMETDVNAQVQPQHLPSGSGPAHMEPHQVSVEEIHQGEIVNSGTHHDLSSAAAFEAAHNLQQYGHVPPAPTIPQSHHAPHQQQQQYVVETQVPVGGEKQKDGRHPIPARVLAVVVNNPLNDNKAPPPPPPPIPTEMPSNGMPGERSFSQIPVSQVAPLPQSEYHSLPAPTDAWDGTFETSGIDMNSPSTIQKLTKQIPQSTGPMGPTNGSTMPLSSSSSGQSPYSVSMNFSPVRAWSGPSPPPPPPLPRNLDCHICGYKAPYPSKLRVHIDHHLKNRRFRCQKCPKAYVTKSELRRHMKRLNHSDVPIAGYNRRNRRTFDARATGWTCAVCGSDRVVAPGGRGSKLANVLEGNLQGDLHPRRIVIEGEEPKSVCNACYVHYHRYKTLRPKPLTSTRAQPTRKPARVSEEMKERETLLREQHGDKDWLFKCKCARRCVALFLTQRQSDDRQWEISEQKVKEIVDVHKVADQLSKEKYVTVDHQGKPLRPGPGGGQRKSPTFTAHVLNSRAIYSDLCEIAKQHILVYSNGFLHYKPVNGVPRVEIKRREYKIAVEHLSTYQCCRRKCLEGITPEYALKIRQQYDESSNQDDRKRLVQTVMEGDDRGIRQEYVTKKRQEYEDATQDGRNRLVQTVIEGDGRGPYRCVKSIKALLGCGEHVISAAFRTVMHDKVSGVPSAPHRNRGRSPANRTPPEVEEKFKDHLFNVTTAHVRDPQIRVLKRSCDSNKKLRKSFNEIHDLDISESTLRNVQKRVMAQNGIKRVERPEVSDGTRINTIQTVPISAMNQLNPFVLPTAPGMQQPGAMAPATISAQPLTSVGAMQQPTGASPLHTQPEEQGPALKRRKIDKSEDSDASMDDGPPEEPSTPPPPPPPGAPPPSSVDPNNGGVPAPAMMIHPPPPPGAIYSQFSYPPTSFGQFPMHLGAQHFFPSMVPQVPNIGVPLQHGTSGTEAMSTGVGDGDVQKPEVEQEEQKVM